MDYIQRLHEVIATKKIGDLKKVLQEAPEDLELPCTELIDEAITLKAVPIVKHLLTVANPDQSLYSRVFLSGVQTAQEKIITLALEGGADPNALDSTGKNGAILAVETGKIKILQQMIELDLDLNVADQSGDTPLIKAIKENREKMVEIILNQEIDINQADSDGNTPLHHALLVKKGKLIELIVAEKPDFNAQNRENLTPLALAWKLNSTPKIIDLLLEPDKIDLSGAAGEVVMTQAYNISQGAKKTQRKQLKELFFPRPSQKLTRKDFLEKHGELKVIFPKLSTLETPNGGEKIMKGIFTNIGYFPRESNPFQIEHNWDALDQSLTLAKELADTLNSADCYAPNTEGGSPYEPFVIPYAGWIDLINLDAKPSSEAHEAARGAYEKWIVTDDPYNHNPFFESPKQQLNEGFIDQDQYDAFRKTGKLMRRQLTDIRTYMVYPDFIEFPWIFAGLDANRNLVGVATTAVWT